MTTIEFIVFLGGLMLLSGLAGGVLATFKNRDISFWVAWTFLMPPSLLVLAFLPKRQGPRPRRSTLDEEDTMMDKI
ncbi:MAG: hypothetical protein ACR2PG_11520 [Hyphomicrobiaceae bacterium]